MNDEIIVTLHLSKGVKILDRSDDMWQLSVPIKDGYRDGCVFLCHSRRNKALNAKWLRVGRGGGLKI